MLLQDRRVRQLEVMLAVNDREAYRLLMSALTLQQAFERNGDDGLLLTVRPTFDVRRLPAAAGADLHCPAGLDFCLGVRGFGRRR